METPASHSPKRKTRWMPVALIAGLLVIFILISSRHSEPQAVRPAKAGGAVAVSNPPTQTATTNSTTSPAIAAGVLPGNTNFQKRPFPAAYESPGIQWTIEDGKDTNVIRQLAHNLLEYDRMVEENPRIFKRQLVYLKETAASVFEQAKLTGQPVQQLTLPGVDGQELQFDIVQSEGNGSSRHGMFSGHLAGNLDSMVTLAFQDGREAFTVISPKDNLFIVGEPREDRQVIVKAIDPNTYGMAAEGGEDYIKTGPATK